MSYQVQKDFLRQQFGEKCVECWLSEPVAKLECQRCTITNFVLVVNYIILDTFHLTQQNGSATTAANRRDAEARACTQTVDRR